MSGALFLRRGARPPFLLWRPASAICPPARWSTCPCGGVDCRATAALPSLQPDPQVPASVQDYLILAEPSEDRCDFTYRHYGAGLIRAFGRDMRGAKRLGVRRPRGRVHRRRLPGGAAARRADLYGARARERSRQPVRSGGAADGWPGWLGSAAGHRQRSGSILRHTARHGHGRRPDLRWVGHHSHGQRHGRHIAGLQRGKPAGQADGRDAARHRSSPRDSRPVPGW